MIIYNIETEKGVWESEISFLDIIKSMIDRMDWESSAPDIKAMYLTNAEDDARLDLWQCAIDDYQKRLDAAQEEARETEEPYRSDYL